jgi:signal transduction histidine kinase
MTEFFSEIFLLASSRCALHNGSGARACAGYLFEGTGIGLAIVKKAMERMNGKVGVTINADAGCTFWFELPEAG